MKNALLGTTALVSLSLLAGSPAFADAPPPLKVTINGDVIAGFYVIDADSTYPGQKTPNTSVKLSVRNLDIKVDGTLDNGLDVGVDAKLQLGNDWNPDLNSVYTAPVASFRQLFAYMQGGFGRFEIGGTDGAAYKMHYTSPWFVPGNGVDTPNIYNSLLSPTRVSTYSLMAEDSNKISYFTPRLAGFQLGLSFTPDATVHGPFENGLTLPPTADGYGSSSTRGTIGEVFEGALNYTVSFSGIDFAADAFYVEGNTELAGAKPQEAGFGSNITYCNFTLGGAFYHSQDLSNDIYLDPAENGISTEVWTAGLKYTTGPWTVGVAYLQGQDDTNPTSLNYTGSKNQSWQTGGDYNLAAGVDVGLDVQYNKVKTSAAEPYENAASAGLILDISF